MRIGIDIDGVLTDVGQFSIDYLSKFCVENNISYKIGESDYDLTKTFGINSDVEDEFWEEYLDYYANNEKARPFAAEVIKKLKEEGHEIYIITARWLTNRDDEKGENMRKTVKEWLAKNGIIYDKLVFSKASHEKKAAEMIEHKIDLMIEDSPRNIKDLSKLVSIICYDTSYNKECQGENIVRCFSWYDIYKTIKNLK